MRLSRLRWREKGKSMTDARVRLIITGLIAVMLTGVAGWLWATGETVPVELVAFVTAVWGYFAGHVRTNGTGAP